LFFPVLSAILPHTIIVCRGGNVPSTKHDVLKVEEIAAALRCGRNQAYELVKSGAIRSVRIGRAIRGTREALEEFKAGGRARSA
jgi:excisionase family DNA binding protein